MMSTPPASMVRPADSAIGPCPRRRRAPRCPILRRAASGDDADSRLRRVPIGAAGSGQSWVLMSAVAARAIRGLSWQQALQRAQAAGQADDARFAGLDAMAWSRLGTLLSFVAPHAQTLPLPLPLLLLPPPRLRPLDPLQELQSLLTQQLGRPGWPPRLRWLLRQLPDAALRQDLSRFVAALVPRLIAAARSEDPWVMRDALEDAWLDARVQRRWSCPAANIDASTAERLLRLCAAARMRDSPRPKSTRVPAACAAAADGPVARRGRAPAQPPLPATVRAAFRQRPPPAGSRTRPAGPRATTAAPHG